jgi:hypothetical protein
MSEVADSLMLSKGDKMDGWVAVSEMARIGIALRGGADKKGYFDWKAAEYAEEGWSREVGEKLWDSCIEEMARKPLAANQAYVPISD